MGGDRSFILRNRPGPERKDDWRIIPGILHVITAGCRWCDCPNAYGPSTTVYSQEKAASSQ